MQKMEFKKNACDPCIYNKKTADGIVTIRTHVDDLKVLSRSTKLLQEVI
jgi:hypothetical protein